LRRGGFTETLPTERIPWVDDDEDDEDAVWSEYVVAEVVISVGGRGVGWRG